MNAFLPQTTEQKYINDLTSLLEKNDYLSAIPQVRSGIRSKPSWVEGYALLGRLLWQTGQHNEAADAFQDAIRLQPDNPEWQIQFLRCKMKLGEFEQTVPKILNFVANHTDNSSLIIEGVSLLSEVSQHDVAVACLTWCLKKRPDDSVLCSTLAAELISSGRASEGSALFIDLMTRHPDTIGYTPIIVAALGNIGEFDFALRISEAYQESDLPKSSAFLNNIACALVALNRSEEAIPYCEAGLAIEPENEDLRFGLAAALLKSGAFEKGWRQHELRPALLRRRESRPWRGEEDVHGKTLLLIGDQGLGDCIQFIRYIRFFKDTGTRLIVAVEAPLQRLFANMAVRVEVCDIDERPEHDLSCPLLSLPFALMRFIGTTIPAEVPYLHPYPEDLTRFSSLPDPGNKKRIGVVWSGAKRAQYGLFYRARSSSLKDFLPILEQKEAEFVNLQLGEPRDEIREAGLATLIDPMDDVRDMADTAAIIQSLDLIISVDTSVAHLAGALGKPVWMLTRSDCCWRWLEDRDDTPWYPTMRIFRSEPGSLQHAISLAARELPHFLGTARLQPSDHTYSKDEVLV